MRTTLAALAQIGRLATPPPSAAASTLPPELKVRDFFREVCRFVPWAVKNYRLDELTTPAELRSHIAALFRARGPALGTGGGGGARPDPRVIDLLIYKGREELESVVLQHKQRHHLIGDYITAPRAARSAAASQGGGAGAGESPFLRAFYANTV